MNKKRSGTTLWIDDDTRDALRVLAREDDRTMSSEIRQIVRALAHSPELRRKVRETAMEVDGSRRLAQESHD